jgi:hypothetical protein
MSQRDSSLESHNMKTELWYVLIFFLEVLKRIIWLDLRPFI